MEDRKNGRDKPIFQGSKPEVMMTARTREKNRAARE